jgi:hypothetical protein
MFSVQQYANGFEEVVSRGAGWGKAVMMFPSGKQYALLHRPPQEVIVLGKHLF